MADIDVNAAFRLGRFEIDLERNIIRMGADEQRLEPKVMGVLQILATSPGSVVSRVDLIDQVWGIEHGGDESLTRAVSLLRNVFRQSDDATTYIETVPRRGYRLAVPPESTGVAVPEAHAPDPSEHSTAAAVTDSPSAEFGTPSRTLALAIGAAILLTFGLLGALLRPAPQETQLTVEIPSIAVLPFENLSPDPDNAYFSRGVSEEILSALTRVDALRVIGRTSSFNVVSNGRDFETIRDALDVDNILDGSVRISDDRVRITAQLIDATNGAQIWTESYDRELDDVFAIQAEIAQIVEHRLRGDLVPNANFVPIEALDVRPDFETYQLYLRGVEAFRRRFVFDDNGAIALLEATLQREPDFLPAKAHLAVAHSVAAINQLEVGRMAEGNFHQDKTLSLATAVLSEDAENGLALTALGAMSFQKSDFVDARNYYERAIAADPSNDTTALFLSALLRASGNPDFAREILEHVQQSNPTSSSLNRGLAMRALEVGDYQLALGHAKLASDYGAEQGFYMAAVASALLGDISAARALRDQYEIAEQDKDDLWRLDALDAAIDPSAREAWLDQLLATNQIGEQFLIRAWGENEVADSLLVAASSEGGYVRRQPLPLQRVWLEGGAGYRQSAVFRDIVEHWNLPAYWKVYGFPSQCEPVGDDDFVCR